MHSLGDFASSAYQILASLDALKSQNPNVKKPKQPCAKASGGSAR